MGSNSSFVNDYRAISITPVLSKVQRKGTAVYEKLVASQLSCYLDSARILPDSQCGFRKDLSTTDAMLHASHFLQSALDHGNEAKIVKIDFSAAFDRVNHKGLLFKFRSVVIGGSIFL